MESLNETGEDSVVPFDDQLMTPKGPLMLKERNLTIVNLVGSPTKPSLGSPTAYPPRSTHSQPLSLKSPVTSSAQRAAASSLLPANLAQDVSHSILSIDYLFRLN